MSQPLHQNGLIAYATTPHKRRLSDELPPFLGSYIPTLEGHDQRRTVPSAASARNDWHDLWEECKKHLYYTAKATYSVTTAAMVLLLNELLQLRNRHWRAKDFLDIRIALVIVWVLLLRWGEITVFDTSVSRCTWEQWEDWPSGATPHRLALVADPQLVDPHT